MVMGRLNRALTSLLLVAAVALVAGGIFGGLSLLPRPEDQEPTTSPSAPLQTCGGGDAQETPVSLIQIEEVDTIEDVGPLAGSAPPPQRSAPSRSTPLDELKVQMGVLYVPSYVPAGFTLSQSSPRGLIYQSGRRQISIYQDSSPGRPRVKRGYVESISVNGQSGYLIRGIGRES
jgi:hypothetical protein